MDHLTSDFLDLQHLDLEQLIQIILVRIFEHSQRVSSRKSIELYRLDAAQALKMEHVWAFFEFRNKPKTDSLRLFLDCNELGQTVKLLDGNHLWTWTSYLEPQTERIWIISGFPKPSISCGWRFFTLLGNFTMARTLVASRRSLKTNRGDLRNSPSFAQRSCHSWPMAGTVWRPGRPDSPGTVPRGRDRCQLAEILLIDWLFEVEFPKSSPHRLLANSSFIRLVFVCFCPLHQEDWTWGNYRQQNWQPCSHINN